MSRVIKVQTNFAVGEINPELRGRIDLRQYESALERARNVICKPQGSIERRPGLRFLFQVPSNPHLREAMLLFLSPHALFA